MQTISTTPAVSQVDAPERVTTVAHSVLRVALEYIQRGWSVVPVSRSKRSIVPWKAYQRRIATSEEVHGWFDRPEPPNVAIVLGAVSGGLAARDFDTEASWRAFLTLHADLAAELPVVQTARGTHLYFTAPGPVNTRKLKDGELRGEGGYVVAPPSVHETGIVYSWINEPTDLIPIVNLEVFTGGVDTGHHRTTKDTEDPPDTKDTSAELAEIILRTLPVGSGKRHECIFAFVRELKGRPEFANRCPLTLWPEFQEWWRLAGPRTSGAHEATDSFADFLEGWAECRSPVGAGRIADCIADAKKGPPHPAVSQFDDEDLHTLARLCELLGAGRPNFWLSARSAARAIDKSRTSAWGKVILLSQIGLIELVERGTRGSKGKATVWRMAKKRGAQ